jgi:hypothetical protein
MPPPIKGIRKITQEDIEFAAGLLGQGESVDSVRAKLIDRNLTPANAEAVIAEVHVQAVYADAAGMLNAGQPPDQVKQALVANRGLTPQDASTVVDNLLGQAQGGGGSDGSSARAVIGGIIIVIGIGLWIGNMTGVFPTFPFAGIITIVIGSAIAGSGQR